MAPTFGPQGSFWDEAFEQKPLRQDLKDGLRGSVAGAVSLLVFWWLRSRGVHGLREWIIVVVVAFLSAWAIGSMAHLARRQWHRRHSRH